MGYQRDANVLLRRVVQRARRDVQRHLLEAQGWRCSVRDGSGVQGTRISWGLGYEL